MHPMLQGLLSVVGRVLLCSIFLMSAVANKIPKFEGVAELMGDKGIPAPTLALVGAIVFLIAGSLSIVLGVWARIGALLLFTFLVLASYYFHAFWAIADPAAQQVEMGNFMKNLALMGAMLFIMGNGSGAMSLDSRLSNRAA